MKALSLIMVILSALVLASCQGKTGQMEGPAKETSPMSNSSIQFYGMKEADKRWVEKSIKTYHPSKQKALNEIRIAIVNFPSVEKLGKWCPMRGSGCAMACELDKPGGDSGCNNGLTGKRLKTDYILAIHSMEHTDYQYQTLAHEFGHILHHAYVDEKELDNLFGALEQNKKGCYADELGDCMNDVEVLADQISRCTGEEYLGKKTPLEWSHYLIKDLNQGDFCKLFYKALDTKASS